MGQMFFYDMLGYYDSSGLDFDIFSAEDVDNCFER